MDLFKEDRTKAGLWDIVDWWLFWYPDDVFAKSPKAIVNIRDEMKKLKRENQHIKESG